MTTPPTVEIHPGVFRYIGYRAVVYTGTADSLVSAGILEQGQFPGQPGNPRTMCSFAPDGKRAGRGTGLYCRAAPGKKRVIAERGGLFTVRVHLSDAETDALKAKTAQAAACWPFPVVHGTAYQPRPRRGA